MPDIADTLYVGMDDSNHGARVGGEINVATFSLIPDDCIVKRFGKRTTYDQAQQWLESPSRHYLFTVLDGEEPRHRISNLLITAPRLITHYMNSFREYSSSIRNIMVYVDGFFNERDLPILKDSLPKHNVTAKSFPKERGIIHHCPQVVFKADILAYWLYRKPSNVLRNNERYVPIEGKLPF